MGIFKRRGKGRDVALGTICFLIAFTAGLMYIQMTAVTANPLAKLSIQYLFEDPIIDQTKPLFQEQDDTSVDVYETTNSYHQVIDLEADYTALPRDVDLRNVSLPVFMIGNKSMCDSQVEILVYIQSAWENFLKRRSLRRTWASSRRVLGKRVKTFFILGRPKNINDQVRINNEQLLHGDIIEGDFIDSYQNISIKSVIALSWTIRLCSHVKYVIKSDDDIFVNLFNVIDNVLPGMSHDTTSLACHVKEAGTSPIVRDSASKWYIPSNVFPNMTYLPRFCSGYFVVMTYKTVKKLFNQSKKYPLIDVDDVYIFGQLTQNTGIKFIDIRSNLTLSDAEGVRSYKKRERRYLGVGVSGTNSMEELWGLTLQEQEEQNM